MSQHRYSSRTTNADLLRAAIGLACCLVPLVSVELGTVVTLVFAVPAALFAVFGLRTWRNRGTIVTVDADGIAAVRQAIAWDALATVKLSYFSTRRDRENGWMQLKLAGGGTTITVNSGLEEFEVVCRAAFEAARSHGIELTDASARNFAALGLGAIVPDHDPVPAALTGWGNPADWRR